MWTVTVSSSRSYLRLLRLAVLIVSSRITTSNGFLVLDYRSKSYSHHHQKDFALSEAAATASSSSNNNNNSGIKTNNNNIINCCDARHVAVRALTEFVVSSKNKKATTSTTFSLRKLESDKYFNQLELRDKRFARNLVSTVERRRGQIDKVLNFCMDTPLGQQKVRRKQDAIVHATLRVGAAQLLFLGTPQYAAIKETVQVLRMNHRIKIPESKIKFVNAVLRRISREQNDNNLLDSETSPHDNIAPWLLQEWKQSWGEEKLTAIAEAAMMESPVFLSINHQLASSQQDKIENLQSVQDAFHTHYNQNDQNNNKNNSETSATTAAMTTEILSQGSIYIDKASFPGAISKWPLYDEGEWWVQDASATLPAIALYKSLLATREKDNDESSTDINSLSSQRRQSIVDICAAPGGKTAQLLSLGFPFVTAIEFSATRAKQLRSNLERLHLEERCHVVVEDACNWSPEEGGHESVSGILLDVPCSSTGTASRRPDVLRRDQNLDELLETQNNLATHCVDNLLEPGGILVYATCSLLKRESEDQIQKLLHRTDGAKVQVLPFSPGEIPGFDDAIDELGCLRVIPGWLPGKLRSCDGFFVARLQKL